MSLNDHLITAISHQQVSCLCLLDLSDAFDTIDHSLLLHRLSSWFGIADSPLTWFKTYLTSRSFSVLASGFASPPYPLSCGVPQGYCNSLYLNLPQKQISRRQLLQNSLARLVTRTPKTEHITPVLKSLHCLKIEELLHYLLAPLVLLIISLYSVHPPPLLLKLLIVHTAEPLLSPGIIYQNLRTFSNTSPNSATTSQCTSLALSLSKTQFRSHLKTPFRHHVPTLTFFPARTDHIDLYPNNDLNHTLRAGNISGHFGLLFLRAPYKFQFYLLT